LLHEKPRRRGTLPPAARPWPALEPEPATGAAAAGADQEEAAILDRARSGDRDAFAAIVERHQQYVYRLVIRMLRCDRENAADLAQEVFLRVYRGLGSFDGRARFSTWVHKITMNVVISDVRRRRAGKRGRWTFSLDVPIAGTDDLCIEPQERGPAPEERVYHGEIARAVRAAVDTLPDEFREAVLLRDLQDLSYEEIGEILDLPPGTVRSRIHRGRLLLQHKLRQFRP
jgi:RNA polymerase sigma-70 factor (ECF subfamily)